MGADPVRLNLGCGNVRPVGWCNVDPHPDSPERVIVADPLTGLPWGPDTFDGAVAHHVLQMIGWPDLVPWLTAVRVVLKPGAVFRIIVPDLIGAFDAYDEERIDWFPIADELADTIDGKLCAYLSQCGATRSVFTDAWLREITSAAGFVWAMTCSSDGESTGTTGPPWICDLDTRLAESIVMEVIA